MKGIADVLESNELFAGLDAATLKMLAGCATNVAYAAGEALFGEGQQAERFWVIRHGRVTLAVASPGTGQLPIETLGPGSVVGWSWLVAPYRWRFDAVASEPTAAVVFDVACLRTKMDADPKIGYLVLSRFVPLIVERLQATRLRLLDLYGAPAGWGET